MLCCISLLGCGNKAPPTGVDFLTGPEAGRPRPRCVAAGALLRPSPQLVDVAPSLGLPWPSPCAQSRIPSSYRTPGVPVGGSTLVTSLDSLSPNTVTLGIRASARETHLDLCKRASTAGVFAVPYF